nr:RNA-directed DNA polymerase, eukaryota [Tanacetum cinerariifolium]
MELTFPDTHNMIAFLTKSDASEGFEKIIDFLNTSTNYVVRLQALIDRRKVIITKDTIRKDIRLDDADSIDCLPNEEIFAQLARMGLVRNVDSFSKFYMYPRFLQLMINAQVGDLSSHTTKYTSPVLTQKVFVNMRRVGKGFSGVDTPLFEGMLVPQQVHDDVANDLPPNGKTVGSKWLFKKKTDMDGNVHIYKACRVAKGFTQTLGIDYKETFSRVADIRAIRILIAIAAIPMLQSVKTYLGKCFAIKDLEKILKRYCMENSKRRSIPMQEKLKLSKSQGASTPAEMKCMQNVPYASAVGSIMYAVRCTRPDVAGDLKQELRVSCYTDAGHLTDADDLKSQTRYVFVLNGGAIDWKSAKQSIFATSSVEAEYIAAFDASKEAVWCENISYHACKWLGQSCKACLLYHEEVSILSGRKSVPGMYSRSRGNGKKGYSALTVLRCFYLAPGLKINLHKSKLMGIGVSSNVVAVAASLIDCFILTAPFNYLGMKVGSNMSRITSWDDVISKVSLRLSKWKIKLLSIGGRLSLLKSVLTSIPLYHMSIFKVSIGVLNHLESIRRNIFYGVDGSDRKLAWIG